MKQGKRAVCSQQVFEPLLSDLKRKDSKVDNLATEILNNVMDLVIKEMEEVFPKDEIQAFAEIFEETEAYYKMRNAISMALMPEEG